MAAPPTQVSSSPNDSPSQKIQKQKVQNHKAVQSTTGKTSTKKALQPQAPVTGSAGSGGAVVFVDPVTGQIREPSAAEIGTLAPAQAPGVIRREVRPSFITGAGGAVGIVHGDDTLNYMVVTKTPDGKLVVDCVSGAEAAKTQVLSGPTEGHTQGNSDGK